MLLMTLSIFFCHFAAGQVKRHVPNSAYPDYSVLPTYDISLWTSQLHLQLCTIVEIRESYCALFVEVRPHSPYESGVYEYFLGICDINTLRKWKFCSPALERQRPYECTFFRDETYTNSRVHRRLCDITNIAYFGENCNCSYKLGGQDLYRVKGFPTCFLPPSPYTLCQYFNVCGLSICNASTVLGRIQAIQCNPNCVGHQPFCEYPSKITAKAPEISSFWTDWVDNESCDDDLCLSRSIYSEATCINKFTGEGAIDCLGPGTSCCPKEYDNCKCGLFMEGSTLKVFRIYKPRLHLYPQKRSINPNMEKEITREENLLAKLQLILGPDKRVAKHRLVSLDEDEEESDIEDLDDPNEDEEDIAIEEEEITITTADIPEANEFNMRQVTDNLKDKKIENAFDDSEKLNDTATNCAFRLFQNYACQCVTFTYFYLKSFSKLI